MIPGQFLAFELVMRGWKFEMQEIDKSLICGLDFGFLIEFDLCLQ